MVSSFRWHGSDQYYIVYFMFCQVVEAEMLNKNTQFGKNVYRVIKKGDSSMVRGLFQNAVVINNPGGGKVFRQAIFLLQPDAVTDERQLAEEAQCVIEAYTSARKKGKLYK